MGLMQGDTQRFNPVYDSASIQEFKELKDRVSQLETIVYALTQSESLEVPDEVLHSLHIEEAKKRATILERLEVNAKRRKDAVALGQIWKANVETPLEDQFTFDVNSYLEP